MDKGDFSLEMLIALFAIFIFALIFIFIYSFYTNSQVSKKCWNMPYEEYVKDTRCRNVIERNS